LEGNHPIPFLSIRTFNYEEDYPWQYLHKVPKGSCGLKGTGVAGAIGAASDLPSRL
jgi:hypothetical protein